MPAEHRDMASSRSPAAPASGKRPRHLLPQRQLGDEPEGEEDERVAEPAHLSIKQEVGDHAAVERAGGIVADPVVDSALREQRVALRDATRVPGGS